MCFGYVGSSRFKGLYRFGLLAPLLLRVAGFWVRLMGALCWFGGLGFGAGHLPRRPLVWQRKF